MIQSWDEYIEFPPEKIQLMQKEIERHKEEDKLQILFVNPVLREDVFNILDEYCTVVFYPFADSEENDGFHVVRPVAYGGKTTEHFVCINTAKPIAKQVFAAAHELGHIWNLIDMIWADGFDMEGDLVHTEAAMNRFAAELLMPESIFRKSAETLLLPYKESRQLRVIDAIRAIADLMNEFCVPAQAVVLRLYETGCLNQKICEQILITGPSSKQDVLDRATYQLLFEKNLSDCINERGYTRIVEKSTRKKGIKGFPQLLDEAEKKELFAVSRLHELRKLLDIPEKCDSDETAATLDLNT